MFLFLILTLLNHLTYATTLSVVRPLCETLTNHDVVKAQGWKLLERRPIMIFHVRHLCEEMEMLADQGQDLDLRTQELELIYSSFIDRHRVEAGLGPLDILRMGMNHDLSPYLLRFKKTAPDLQEVAPSPVWQAPRPPLHQAFDRQWLALKINPEFQWGILDKLEGKGSAPKVHMQDMQNGGRWLLKWGDEVHTDPVASRIFAALGYNVDFPFYRPANSMHLVLGRKGKKPRTVQQLVNFIFNSYGVNLSPFITKMGRIDASMVRDHSWLRGHEGETFLTFTGVAVEPRNSNEARLGGILFDHPHNSSKRELKGLLLAHLWLGSWDTKEDNTLWALRLLENNQTQMMGVISDLGLSLGVHPQKFPRDIKTGLVNELPWEFIEIKQDEIRFNAHMNHLPGSWLDATYSDLHWMAKQIARISRDDLSLILTYSGWPAPLQALYLEKILSRRQEILKTFEVSDPFRIQIDREYSSGDLIRKGRLIQEVDLKQYPQGLFRKEGRFRGFGW